MLRKFQKKLRKNSTPEESFMWSLLRNRKLSKFKFRRQVIIRNFIVDFVCYERKLIIELDGGQHIQNEKYDDMRTKVLEGEGYHVMRIWNFQIKVDAEKILQRIYRRLVEER